MSSTVRFHAQLNPIKAIVRLCSPYGQLQLSEYTVHGGEKKDSLAEACHLLDYYFCNDFFKVTCPTLEMVRLKARVRDPVSDVTICKFMVICNHHDQNVTLFFTLNLEKKKTI